jgi:hypothetical protein
MKKKILIVITFITIGLGVSVGINLDKEMNFDKYLAADYVVKNSEDEDLGPMD